MRYDFSIFVVGITALSMGVAAGQPAPATRPVSEPPVVAPAAERALAEDEKAANEVSDYLSAHRDELEPSLKQVNFNPDGGADEYLKLKVLLPARLAAEVDLAVPVLNKRRINNQIRVNLQSIGTALAIYATQKQATMPDALGALVSLVPSVMVFVPPDATIPLEVKQGTPDQQTPWINAHTMFAFLAAGKKAASSATAIVAYERMDLDTQKPRLAVLYGDGHVETLDRAALEGALKQQ